MPTVTCEGSTCTLVVTAQEATPDDYAAVSLIFGSILTAACVIWGVKQVLALLRDRPES